MTTEVKFQQPHANPFYPGVTDLTPSEVHQHLQSITIVDVREAHEFVGELGHIPGALHLILSTLPQNLKNIPTDKPIVFVCRSGSRSAQAAAFAKKNGLDNVFNLKGGMLMWNELHFATQTNRS